MLLNIFLVSLVPYLNLRKDVLSLIELVKRTLSGPSVLDAFYHLVFSDIKNRKIWLFSVVLKSYIKNWSGMKLTDVYLMLDI